MGKKVIKRDGSKEEFAPEKISRVIEAAGLEPAEAQALADIINNWAISHKDDEISSLDIRDIVLTELKKVDPHVASMFAWYQKTKDL